MVFQPTMRRVISRTPELVASSKCSASASNSWCVGLLAFLLEVAGLLGAVMGQVAQRLVGDAVLGHDASLVLGVVGVALGFGRGLRFSTWLRSGRDAARTHHLDQSALLQRDEVVGSYDDVV